MPYKSIVEQVKSYDSPFYLNHILVSPTLNELRIDDQVVKLEPKVMAVLVMLAAHGGEVVSRQALMDHVWQGMVVGDDVVTRTIFELRRAFADSAKNPTYFATIPKKGYRCQVRARRGDNNPKAKAGIKRSAMFAACLLGLGLLPFLYSQNFIVEQTAPGAKASLPAAIQSQPETSLAGLESDPAISNNGQWLAFVHRPEKELQANVYIKNLHSSEVVQLTDNNTREAYPQWSGDGRSLAFVRCRAKNSCSIISKNIEDLSERTLYRSEQAIACLAWSEPLNIMVFCRENTAAVTGGHLRMLDLSKAGQQDYRDEHFLPRAEPSYYRDRSPVFTADGQILVFVRASGEQNDIYAYQVNGQQLYPLLSSKSYISHLGFSPKGDFLVLSQIKDARWGLWYTPFNPGENQLAPPTPLLVKSDKSTLRQPAVNPVNGRVYYIDGRGERNIARYALSENTNTPLITSTANDYDGQLSPDGQRLAFISNRTGAQEVWLADMDGRHQQKLTKGSFTRIDQIYWSQDGQQLAIQVHENKQNSLVVIDAASKESVRQLPLNAGERLLSWSADNLSLILGRLKGQQYSLYRLTATDHRELLVKDAGPLATESENGAVLYYYHYRAKALYRQSLLTGEAQMLTADVNVEHFTNAGFASGSFYYVDGNNEQVYRIALATGERSFFTDILPPDGRLSNAGTGFQGKEAGTGEYLLFDATYNSQVGIRSLPLPDALL